MSVISAATTEAGAYSTKAQSPLTTPPLFIFGCPRSGTTFLGELLNLHPRALVTNEIRLMAFLTDVFDRSAQNRHLLHNPDYKDKFVAHARSRSELLVRTFYDRLGRDLGKQLTVWGDKTPGYADPLLSKGCLRFTREIFPGAKWIHIRRDPRAVVNSLVTKRWHTLASAVDIWARITREGREFGRTLPASQYLEIVHEDILNDVEGVTKRIFAFVGLDICAEVDAFVQAEKVSRVPISDPVNLAASDLAASAAGHSDARHGLNGEQEEQVRALVGDRIDDIEAMLSHYFATDAGQATAEAIASGAAAVASDSKGVATERLDVPQGFSPFTPIAPEGLLGDLEARITGVSVLINGASVVPLEAATVRPGDRVDIAVRFVALKAFAHVVAGFSVVDRAGAVVGGGNNASSGLGTLAAGPGAHTALLSFRWPNLADAPFSLTLGLGEGTGSPADGESNHVQCWVPEAVMLRQRAKELKAGETVTISVLHSSIQKP